MCSNLGFLCQEGATVVMAKFVTLPGILLCLYYAALVKHTTAHCGYQTSKLCFVIVLKKALYDGCAANKPQLTNSCTVKLLVR